MLVLMLALYAKAYFQVPFLNILGRVQYELYMRARNLTFVAVPQQKLVMKVNFRVVLFLTAVVVEIGLILWVRRDRWTAHVSMPRPIPYLHSVGADASAGPAANNTITVVAWTAWIGKTPGIKSHTADCDGYKCLITSNKSNFSSADALVFHARGTDIQRSLKQALTLVRPSRQRWVLYNFESPVNTPNLRFLNGHINWTINHMTNSDISFDFVLPGTFQDGFDPGKDYMKNKPGTAVILVSNCIHSRMEWVRKIQKYIDVKVYGNCGNMRCGSKQNCYAALRKYKFYLSFENSFCKDYVTEKLYENAFQNEIVPVIIASVNTSDVTFLPPGSFINALDFPTVKDLTDHMTTVGHCSDLYNEYFKWHSNYTLNIKYHHSPTMLCELCKKMHLDTSSVKTYHDIGSWYSVKRNCMAYPKPH